MNRVSELGTPNELHLEVLLENTERDKDTVFVSGKHLGKLEDARILARKEIDQLLDIPVPDAVFKRAYLFDSTDRVEHAEYSERFNDIILHDSERLKDLFEPAFWSRITLDGRILPSGSHLRETFQAMANEHLKKRMSERMKELGVDPVMTIESSLEPVPEYRELPLGTDNGFDCALQTFAMNVAAIMDTDRTACSLWDTYSLRKTAESQRTHSPHDLPWLLGSLATDLASRKLHYDIRVRTFVGADFGEIEEKYIAPIKRRMKTARFILNTMLVSSSLKGANHFMIVTAADENRVSVSDPKHGQSEIPSNVFWERWVPTNLQASLVIAVPHAEVA